MTKMMSQTALLEVIPCCPKSLKTSGCPQCGQFSASLLTCALHAEHSFRFGFGRTGFVDTGGSIVIGIRGGGFSAEYVLRGVGKNSFPHVGQVIF